MLVYSMSTHSSFRFPPNNNCHEVKIFLNHPDAKLPEAQHPGDVAFDISSVEDVVLKPHSSTKVRTGLVIADMSSEEVCYTGTTDNQIPSALFPKVESRSGLASQGIFTVGGILDNNYLK